MNRTAYLRLTFLAALLFATGFIWYVVSAEERGGILTVSFLDVGQGDATFIEAPNGVQLLIDGGPNSIVLSKLGDVMPFYDRHIDAILVTNPDSDHIAGLIDVLKRFSVSAIFEPGTTPATAVYRSLEAAAADKKVPETVVRRGQRIVLDAADGVYFDILFPDQDVSAWKTNDGSTVGRLTYGHTCYIFPGDAPQTTENIVAAQDGDTLHCQVLKAGHHGSRTSSGIAFVGAIAPTYAVISSSAGNSYGHPHQETLDMLNRFGVKVLRTDTQGTITMHSDGTTVSVE